jgi:hypothetical protein
MGPTTDQPAITQLGNYSVNDSASTFLASLLPDEQILFQATKAVEALLHEVNTSNKEHRDASVSHKASTALLPFIAGIEQYRQAIDVFANSNDFLCPIWGSIRIVLHVRKDLVTVSDRGGLTEYAVLACDEVWQVFR